jgi:hypothetical protein
MPDLRTRQIATLLLLLFALATPLLAEESATARFTAYLSAMRKAKSFADIRPYFTDKGWSQTYADLETAPQQDQARMLSDTADELKGWKVSKETLKEGKAILTVGPGKGEGTEVLMIKKNGHWAIDG